MSTITEDYPCYVQSEELDRLLYIRAEEELDIQLGVSERDVSTMEDHADPKMIQNTIHQERKN